MKFTDHSRYANYFGKYFSLTIDKTNQKLAFFGCDSGGRQPTRFNSYNLVMPSHGGRAALAGRENAVGVAVDAQGVSGNFTAGKIAYRIDGERAFRVELEQKTPRRGTFFTLDLHIEAAPPSIWAKTRIPKIYAPIPKKENVLAATVYQLPLIVSFPDYGLVEISSTDDVECREELTSSPLMSGLNLGGLNYGCHTAMMGLHYGYSRLHFRSRSPLSTPQLTFRVLDEFYPHLPDCDVSDTAFDGLRRCWINAFNLNRSTYSMGDNIYLNGLAHLCIHTKSDMAQLSPVFPNGIDLRKVVEHQLTVTFRYSQADDGELGWEYINTPKKHLTSTFVDCTPSGLIALEGASSWNPAFAAEYLPQALRAANFLMRLDRDDDGILELPFSGRYFDDPMPDGGPRGRNWWDNFGFGHKDGAFNLLCHRALRLTADLAERNGESVPAQSIRAFLQKFESNFIRLFRNPATGVIAGWIDSDGKMHDYMFTFMTAETITEGLLSPAEGRKMLRILLRQMEKQGFNRVYPGIPGPTLPVPLSDTFDWPFMAAWPHYENGGICGMPAFYFLNALYLCGLKKEADKLLFAMLDAFETQDTHSGLMPGYMKSIDWRTKDGNPSGYNYLADNYYYLLAVYTGYFGRKHPAIRR